MSSISFYVPPPTPSPARPPTRPAALDHHHKHRQPSSLPRGQVQDAVQHVEQHTRLRCLTTTLLQEGGSIASYSLCLESGQRLRLILYTGDTHAHAADKYAALLTALDHLTASSPTPLRILAPIAVFRQQDYTAVLLPDLIATLNLDTSTSTTRTTGNGIRARTAAHAGTLAHLLTPDDAQTLTTHILTLFQDVVLPGHLPSLRLVNPRGRMARVQVVQLEPPSKTTETAISIERTTDKDKNMETDGRLRAASHRKDSAIGGMGFSPTSVFRTPALPLLDPNHQSGLKAGPDDDQKDGDRDEDEDEEEPLDLLLDLDLLTGPHTQALRLNQGMPKLYLILDPLLVQRGGYVAVQRLCERP